MWSPKAGFSDPVSSPGGSTQSRHGRSSKWTNYDGASHEEFLSSDSQTIAQGINSKGEIVGSTGPSWNRDGFLRDSEGIERLFKVRVDGVSHDTRARGISASGTIAGFYYTEEYGAPHGFVGRLSDDPDDHDLIPYAVFDPDSSPECAGGIPQTKALTY